MLLFRTIVASACVLPALHAQAMQVQLSAVTPLTVSAADGANSASGTYPAGPLPSYWSVNAMLPGGLTGIPSVSAFWYYASTDSWALVQITHGASNPTSSPTFSGQSGPLEFLLEFTSPTAQMATFDASRTLALAPGAPATSAAIDIGNDGSIEVPDLSPLLGAQFSLPVGPQPLQVRVILTGSFGGFPYAGDDLTFRLRPDNDVQIDEIVASCIPAQSPPPPPFAQTSFEGLGIDLTLAQFPAISLAVFGFTAQPTVLSTNGLLPCTLLPSPDVAVLVPNGALNVPIPLTARPISFFAQGVMLGTGGLFTTDGVLVSAL